MRLIFWGLLTGLLALTFSSTAQNKRLEIPLGFKNEFSYAVPIGGRGVVTVSQNRNNALGGDDQWVFTHYNIELKEQARQQVDMPNWLYYEGYDRDGDDIYLLFHRNSSTTFHFLHFNAATGKLNRFKMESLRRFDVKQLKVIESKGFVMGEVKDTPTLLHFRLKGKGGANAVKVLPTSTSRRSEMSILMKDTVNRLMNFSYTNWSGNQSTLIMQSYDPSGEQLVQLSVPSDEGDNPLTGKLSITEGGNALLVGTYGRGARRLATGIYVVEYDGQTQKYLRRYNFIDLEHFFDYLPEKKQRRLEKKQQRRESQDKDLDLQYRLLVHDLVYRDGEYVLLAEAYYPTYRYEQTGFRSGFNTPRGIAQPRMVFDGYQYTHAVVAAFQDDTGELLWDNSFELTSPKTFSLQQKVHIGFTSDKELFMTYSNRGALRSKTIRGNQVVEQMQTVSLLEEDDEVVKRVFAGTVSYWYKNYFLAWGKQRIKDLGEDGAAKRTVFYLNRVPFNSLAE